MSTGSQFRLIDPETDRTVQVYIHSDGYPDYRVPFFRDVRDTLRTTMSEVDISYTAANIVFLSKLDSLQMSALDYEYDSEAAESFYDDEEPDENDWRGDLSLEERRRYMDHQKTARPAEYLERMYDLCATDDSHRAKRTICSPFPGDLIDWRNWGDTLDQPRALLGAGVEAVGDIHGDEEYLYEIEQGDDWRIRWSGDFPRWDNNDDLPDDTDAFAEATWTDWMGLDAAVERATDE